MSAQRKKRERDGTREGPVIKVGWQASTAAAARSSDRDGRGFAQGRRFHAISSEQATLAFWRSIWPAFLALPDHSSAQGKAHGVLAVDAACAGKPAAPTQRSPEPTAARASEPLAMLRSEENPAVAHTFIARPRSPPAISSPAYHRLGALLKCPRSSSVSLCCFCDDGPAVGFLVGRADFGVVAVEGVC